MSPAMNPRTCLLILACAAACSSPSPAPAADAAVDATADTAVDVAPDTGPDAAADVPDTAPDAADIAPDATNDAVPDATPDVAPDTAPEVDTAPDADADDSPDVQPDTGADAAACCPIGKPSCDCTPMGGSPSQPGGCSSECDTAPVGWTQAIDANGCPYWQHIGQSCLLAPVQCAGDPVTFPSYTKNCKVDADCALVLHQVNCCGTLVAWGVNELVEAQFGAAEATCREQYPKCKCAQQPTVADDGKTAPGDAFAVHCVQGKCASYAP